MKLLIEIELEDYLNLITRNGLRPCGFRPQHEITSLQQVLKQDEFIHIEPCNTTESGGENFSAVYPIAEWRASEKRLAALKEEQAAGMKAHAEKLEQRKNVELFKAECISLLVKRSNGKLQPSQADTLFGMCVMLKNMESFQELMNKYNITVEQL